MLLLRGNCQASRDGGAGDRRRVERPERAAHLLLRAARARSVSSPIVDITGVPTVDTLVAQHLMKTVAATRLMGADCIISGIRPQIAQTIVHLGVNLSDIITKATLADAFEVALARLGVTVSKATPTA